MRTIIIDDEPNIRKGLKRLLNKRHPNINIIAEAGDIETSIEIIETHQPELVFLDIELSDGHSFEVLNQLETINFHIIFITAYEQYAIKAFKYSAIDYLLKPVMPQELADALTRLEQRTSTTQNAITLPTLKENLEKPKKIILNTLKQYHVVLIDTIIRCQADQAYTTFYIENAKNITVSKSLKEYEALLSSNNFIRVHQSHLVNPEKVTGYNKDGYIELTNGSTIPVSTRRKDLVLKTLFKN